MQRISTILSFFGFLTDLPEKNNLSLIEGELIGEILKGSKVEDLPTKIKLSRKRSVCRVEILRSDSRHDMRYELFNRLNTGATPLSDQEIRNCVYIGDFNSLLIHLAKDENFLNIIDPTSKQKEEMFLEELVLRHFAVKHQYHDLVIQHKMATFLTDFMKDVTSEKITLSFDNEIDKFLKVVTFINKNIDKQIFRSKNGIFTPNKYDTIMFFADYYFDKFNDYPQKFEELIKEIFDAH